MRSKEFKVTSKNVVRSFCLFTFAFCLLAGTGQALAFKIVSPTEGSALKAGKTVPAKVDLGNDTGVVQVRYYWYGEMDETLVEKEEVSSAGSIVAKPGLVTTASDDPPFGGRLRVPEEAIGTMRLLAVADISRGRLGGRSVFDEILVKVEPEAEITSIEFETDKPLRLGRAGQAATYGQVDSLGKIFELPVVALFSDGVLRSIRQPGTGTSYESSNEKVIKVHPGGLLQVVGNGRSILTVSNRGKQAELDVIVEVNEEPNAPPIADAGTSRTVKAGSRVELNGIKSRDPEGEALFYSWSQVKGSKVPLLDVNMPKASFVAPQVSEKRPFRFKLRVTDKLGADSLPAYVDIDVEP
jgi:K319L-like, PKD domain